MEKVVLVDDDGADLRDLAVTRGLLQIAEAVAADLGSPEREATN